MLSNVHKQLLASRLKDIFASSPLVLVYQTLGNVRSEDMSNSMQRELDKQLPGSGVQATCMKLKNTIASATGQEAVARFLQTNNLLLGWQLPQYSQLDQLQTSKSTHLKSILSQDAPKPPHSPPSSSSPSQPPFPSSQPHMETGSVLQGGHHAPSVSSHNTQSLSLPHNTIKAIISLSLSAPRRQPVALLTSFYRGEQVKIKHLTDWSKLDERAVQEELLSQLESAPSELANLGGAPEALVDALNDAEPHGLLDALDFLAAREESK
ncbi:hypothetical protein DUNSADRAFT_12137 [Dunaliella salina]|uniref:Uncharacterized protein n=1 Tax=Dunaliella salina TaxID=3046 RepID=A0ABQ7GBZ9_DUNSA|nr:hypothetical protein DUNSADRAFT_12137 [Dunaliella salina]|eukprot:KAF5832126.1 hypothetical protein DUNSADRAFT_12137 [Dunaliella salina]